MQPLSCVCVCVLPSCLQVMARKKDSFASRHSAAARYICMLTDLNAFAIILSFGLNFMDIRRVVRGLGGTAAWTCFVMPCRIDAPLTFLPIQCDDEDEGAAEAALCDCT